MELLNQSLQKLTAYVEKEGFRGYDPYDTFNSFIPFTKLGKWPSILAKHLQKRNPVNIRPLIGIKKEYNAKAMGLFLKAYSILHQISPSTETEKHMAFIFNWLKNNYSEGYCGYAWGYNFGWASPLKYVEKNVPSSVVTGYVIKGIKKYHEVTGDHSAEDIIKSAAQFVCKDLEQSHTDSGLCISYTPVMKDCCFNASLLAAEVLSYAYQFTQDVNLKTTIQSAIDFVISRIQNDGRWNYSIDIETGKERKQIDFHQGFVLESIKNCTDVLKFDDGKYWDVLKKGADFYRYFQFFENGQSKWRLPKIWPVEIHNQAQGIITFTLLSELDSGYLDFAERISMWTILNMQDKKGYFYYQKHRYYTNQIPYMRWAQAWMMLAQVTLLAKLKGKI